MQLQGLPAGNRTRVLWITRPVLLCMIRFTDSSNMLFSRPIRDCKTVAQYQCSPNKKDILQTSHIITVLERAACV